MKRTGSGFVRDKKDIYVDKGPFEAGCARKCVEELKKRRVKCRGGDERWTGGMGDQGPAAGKMLSSQPTRK
uniref:HDC15614 n=1 Tax=Drosophila melanogaster TaxID=7227 RepID=Q6IJ92_DROME|nr:TPA_inf: HDC15614 [Drosophila melanogaster]